jgi:co-chaperonin GroES (HSP10)
MRIPESISERQRPEEDLTDEQKQRRIPDPTGWKLLCVVPDPDEYFEGTSLIKSQSMMKQEEHGTTILFVVKLGPDAYKDTTKFPTGPWCKVGDFVLVRTYSGTRFKIYGKEWRLLNDDQIDAVVDDPRGITRVAV